VRAAEALGASGLRVFTQHLLFNLLPVAIILCANTIATAILAETTLSFLGLGLPATAASWGADISSARAALPANVPAMVAPGVAIAGAVLGFNLLSDGLADLLSRR
jgi:ABC-type dipeptide/oligopeptide/nickel transport system permease subunit